LRDDDTSLWGHGMAIAGTRRVSYEKHEKGKPKEIFYQDQWYIVNSYGEKYFGWADAGVFAELLERVPGEFYYINPIDRDPEHSIFKELDLFNSYWLMDSTFLNEKLKMHKEFYKNEAALKKILKIIFKYKKNDFRQKFNTLLNFIPLDFHFSNFDSILNHFSLDFEDEDKYGQRQLNIPLIDYIFLRPDVFEDNRAYFSFSFMKSYLNTKVAMDNDFFHHLDWKVQRLILQDFISYGSMEDLNELNRRFNLMNIPSDQLFNMESLRVFLTPEKIQWMQVHIPEVYFLWDITPITTN
jgi:hypothetical protein